MTKTAVSKEFMADSVRDIVSKIGRERHHVIPILHAVQKTFQYLPLEALREVCDHTDITPADIEGVASFYKQFRREPVGDHMISVCCGTACHVKGAELVHDAFARELHLETGHDTDPNGEFTLQKVACLGCCTIAPVVQIDEVTYGHVHSDNVDQILQDFRHHRLGTPSHDLPETVIKKEMGEIKIGLGSCCVASGSEKVKQAVEDCFEGIEKVPEIKKVGCVGMCHRVPLLEIKLPQKEPILYDQVHPREVPRILSRHFKIGSFGRRLSNRAYHFLENILFPPDPTDFSRHSKDFRDPEIQAFLSKQKRVATEFSGEIDPLDLKEYLARNGFEGLKRALFDFDPKDIINSLTKSGLRGRGGAGFPTGLKWNIAAKTENRTKYVICNGDEGDPGAFMDRMILESFPFRVIEGMCIAARAIGATQGFFYIRAEYPLAVKRLSLAIKLCEKAGFLGDRMMDSDFSLSLKIVEGAGAFVCGEETALIASIEGNRGNPTVKPPFPAQEGLWRAPTLVNNCETLATVPWIMRHGPEPFAQMGTPESKGTKVFSLAGKVVRGGLIEVPMGITIREIVEEIGGGIQNGGEFKAVQIGGPSGGCVPASLADTPVDYENLISAGAMMGSGGLLVMDNRDCMVDIARYFLEFTCDQSCGKCTFCRIGTKLMLDILTRLCEGKASAADLQRLKDIAYKTKDRSLCGLGKTAPNPVLTTLKYFEEEYHAHLEGRCPAGKCSSLITYTIQETCIGCTLCAQSCPVNAIDPLPYSVHVIDQETCTKCDICREVCPNDSVKVM